MSETCSGIAESVRNIGGWRGTCKLGFHTCHSVSAEGIADSTFGLIAGPRGMRRAVRSTTVMTSLGGVERITRAAP